MASEPVPAPFEVGVAACAADGEEVCGDAAVVAPCLAGLLVAVIDGLGHGEPAREAAHRAAVVIRGYRSDELPALVTRCHVALAGTRGAAITLAWLDPSARQLTWIGVGNVAGRLLRREPGGAAPPRVEQAIQLAGVVGQQLPSLRTTTVALAPGDTLLLATDGIAPGVADGLRVHGAVQPLADGLLRRHRRACDDALVLLARIADEEG